MSATSCRPSSLSVVRRRADSRGTCASVKTWRLVSTISLPVKLVNLAVKIRRLLASWGSARRIWRPLDNYINKLLVKVEFWSAYTTMNPMIVPAFQSPPYQLFLVALPMIIDSKRTSDKKMSKYIKTLILSLSSLPREICRDWPRRSTVTFKISVQSQLRIWMMFKIILWESKC